MMNKHSLEPAFVLHTKPYRETSLLIDFFTENLGRVSAIAKSARGPRSRFKGSIVPFAPLLISFSGKNELTNLTNLEVNGKGYFLQGNNLFSGFYLNELLIKLLVRYDACASLFHCYREALSQLQYANDPQKILRIFEKQLLVELGYGLVLNHETTGKKVSPNDYYIYTNEQGLVACEQEATYSFRGSDLLAIEKNNFESPEILKAARRLMRLVLQKLLGHQQLKSRELFL